MHDQLPHDEGVRTGPVHQPLHLRGFDWATQALAQLDDCSGRTHDAIIEAAVAAHDGSIVKGRGDGFLLRFSSGVYRCHYSTGHTPSPRARCEWDVVTGRRSQAS